eukprot:PhM_4_TR15486/c0_g1_i1/m.68724
MAVCGAYFIHHVRQILSLDIHLLRLTRNQPQAIRKLNWKRLSTNVEVSRMQIAILKMKDAMTAYMAYLPQLGGANGTRRRPIEESRGLLEEDPQDQQQNANDAADQSDQEMTGVVTTPTRQNNRTLEDITGTLTVNVSPVTAVFATLSIHRLSKYPHSSAIEAFIKRVIDFISPAVKLSGGHVVGFHHGTITTMWDTQKRTDTLVRNVYAQALGCLMSIASQFKELNDYVTRLGYSDATLNITAASGPLTAGNVGTIATKGFGVFGRVRATSDELRRMCEHLQCGYGKRSVVLVDQECAQQVAGRLLCREVVPGRAYNPFGYDPSVMKTTDAVVKVQQYDVYCKYFQQRLSNGPFSVEDDFHQTLLAEAEGKEEGGAGGVDVVAKRLVMTYKDPANHQVGLL